MMMLMVTIMTVAHPFVRDDDDGDAVDDADDAIDDDAVDDDAEFMNKINIEVSFHMIYNIHVLAYISIYSIKNS